MSWVTLLWAGLLAVAVPLWIFRRRRHGGISVPISSISILRTGRERLPRRWRTIQSRLLWIRMAALFSLALALALVPLPEDSSPSRDIAPRSDSLRYVASPTTESPGSNRHWIVLEVASESEQPLRTALDLMADSLRIETTVVQAEDPMVWSRERAFIGSESGRETLFLQGWPSDSERPDRWAEWIRSGGHLIVEVDDDENLILLNRWLSGIGLEVRAEPANGEESLSPDGIAQWFGERLFGRTVPNPRIHLPDRLPVVIWSQGDEGEVLLRSRSGSALVWRVRVGDGWLTLSGLSWQGGRSGWLYHPLFPFLSGALMQLPAAEPDVGSFDAMESGGDSLTMRTPDDADTPEEIRDAGVQRLANEWAWLTWLGLSLVLFLMESIAGRYLSRAGSGSPPAG